MQIVVAGHLCLDIIPDWQTGNLGALKPGTMVQVDGLTFSTGGAVSNTGIALKRLGFAPILMACTGDDHVGNIVRSIVQREGIDPDHFSCIKGATTSYTIVLNPPGEDRAFIHFPGTNDAFGADDVDLSGLEPGLFHLGYPPIMRELYTAEGENLEAIFRRAKASGWVTSMDMALPDPNSEAGRAPWRRILSRTLPYVDLFLPSLEEILYMLDQDKFYAVQEGALPITTELLDNLSQELLDMGAGVIGLKLGDQGLYLRTGAGVASSLGENWENRQLLSPIFEVEVQGTTGAGDTTIAGFLAGFSLGKDPEEVVTLANGVGACCVEVLSAIEGIPSLTTVEERISRGWPRVMPTIAHPGWHAEHGLLYGPLDKVKR
ncbi:carbohydrate kinase family protein [Candidatus Darwinibacter acetoxidans]|jgi:sugar/nucleoside kinase (ribokinase family)|nr:carbohydrate kinase family protein [Bacillota bacterium]